MKRLFALILLFAALAGLLGCEERAESVAKHQVPPRCANCSLDKDGNLTRPFVVTLVIPRISQPAKESGYSDIPAGVTAVIQPAVYRLSIGNESVTVSCSDTAVTKTLGSYLEDCSELEKHFGQSVLVTYHTDSGGGQNEPDMYYRFKEGGWDAQTRLTRTGGEQWYNSLPVSNPPSENKSGFDWSKFPKAPSVECFDKKTGKRAPDFFKQFGGVTTACGPNSIEKPAGQCTKLVKTPNTLSADCDLR